MILAEKIVLLRKKSGWSQEELAEQLNISRQSVSKWESGTSIPDLDKIIKMSGLFGVSTDYLIKDELEEITGSESGDVEESGNKRSITIEEANSFMDLTRQLAYKMAAACSACVFSPVILIILAGISEQENAAISEDMAGGIGASILLIIIAVAVAVLIFNGMKLSKFEHLETDNISLQYGVKGIVEKKKEAYEDTFRKGITVGCVLCIIGVVPLLIAAGFGASDFACILCTALLLCMIAAGVYLFVSVGYINGSFQKLLQEGDYSEDNKEITKKTSFFPGVYWCIATAIYLGVSLYTRSWELTWIVWPVAGVLFAALNTLVRAIAKRH